MSGGILRKIVGPLDRRLENMRQGSSERGVALLTVLLFIIFMLGLTAALTSVLVSAPQSIYLAQRGTKTVYAAQSGLQVVLGQIRSISKTVAGGAVYGDATKLPCTVSGSVDSASESATYSVKITYYATDPSVDKSIVTNPPLGSCPTGTTSGLTKSPGFAKLESTGTGPAVGGLASTVAARTIVAVYAFNVSNVNIPGGLINNFDGSFCLAAVTATVGSLVKYLPAAQCTDPTLTSWVYATDYELKLASTLTTTPLCITGPVNQGDASQNITLQACLTTAARWNQLWSWFGSSTWLGQKNPISAGNSNYCLGSGIGGSNALTGKYLQVLSACDGSSFNPSSKVGAGAAGYSTHQIVNYLEFGRCMDVTGENINATYMISYPCKQDPTGGGGFNWNHKWFYTEPATGSASYGPQQIYVYYLNNTASKYCLTTPAQNAGGYLDVVFKPCNGASNQNWTRYGNTGNYDTSYVFIDQFNRCITAEQANTELAPWSTLRMESCSGSLAQKWNAPPAGTASSFGSFREVSG